MFQWLFDEAQMQADSVGAPVTTQQWDYVHEMGAALRESLNNVTAVFAPSCIGHSVLTKRDWLDIKIDDISLAEALRCWEKASAGEKLVRRRTANNLTKEERAAKRERRLERQQADKKRKRKLARRQRQRQLCRERRRKLRREQQRLAAASNSTSTTVTPMRMGRSSNPNRRFNNKNLPKVIEYDQQPHRAGGGNKNRRHNCTQNTNHHRHERNNQRKRLNASHNNRHKLQAVGSNRSSSRKLIEQITEPKKCSLRLLERCSWPQCNNSCPMLTNPLTGEEMKFLELLASFGLDMEAVATALGVDMHTLNNMEQAELVNLLTQQAS